MIRPFRAAVKTRGFTLIELAIVLAVTSVLFLGLYRLLSGGNQQVKDTAAASQQIQLINATKTFLSSSYGAEWMGITEGATGSNSIPTPTPLPLVLPPPGSASTGTSNTACYAFYGGDANKEHFCDSLPAGFSTATVNAYGQSFFIQVQPGPILSPAATPSTYSFMIMTLGGDVITDSSGGRISSQIGSDGGFVYSNSNACPTSFACGSYGGWQVAPSSYGFASTFPGHVASRTYYSPDIGSTTPWLARLLMPNDIAATATTSPNYNTMTTPLYLNTNSIYMGTGTNNVLPYGYPATTVPGAANLTLHVQGGEIEMENGNIVDQTIQQENTVASLDLRVLPPYGPAGNFIQANPLLTLETNCSIDQSTAAAAPGGLVWNGTDAVGNPSNVCKPSFEVLGGDANVNGLLQAVSLFSGTFVYQASDVRLKTDIQPLGHALDDIMRMQPVTYKLKAGGQEGIGFVAQDLEKIYPQLVTKGSGIKGVNYEGLVAPLVSAVQDLKRENDDLRQQLQDEIKREDKLERKLDEKP